MGKLSSLIASFTLLFLCWAYPLCSAANVTYDGRSLIIGGQRKLLISASIHYPRSVPAMWPELVRTAKEGGVDVIETYVFWNIHEPTAPGDYHFEGRFDLVKFVEIVQQAGMHLILRIGPFVAAEWNFGGVPVWLHYVPGTVFRTDNYNFKYYMQKFMTYIVNLMKQEKLFAWQGGPIILAQVENEYGFYESFYGDGGKRYAMWAAKMAVSQNTGVPWIMCQQFDAPDPVINTCNSFYCDQFKPISPDKPKIWTENWPGWFQTFGSPNPHRPPEDIAFSVARFFQKGGSLQNYYMYHGGTNFGRTAGGPFISTSYDYDAPIDEYGLARFPKWDHLKELHKAIKFCEHALLNSEPINLSLGPSQEADIFAEASGACAAFLSNMDEENDVTVEFHNVSYHLPAWSVSILPDCRNVVFNTAQVRSQTSTVEMIPEDLRPSVVSSDKGSRKLRWEVFVEKAGIWGEADFVKNGLMDHINTTRDTTDYLWYTTSIVVDENEEFLKKESQAVLVIESKGHALHAFVNQQLQGSASGNGTHSPFKFRGHVSFKPGKNEIALLSMTVGLQNAGPFYEWVGAGLTTVKIEGFNNGTIDLSMHKWTYKIGLQGEKFELYKIGNYGNVSWVETLEAPKMQPLTWYKAVVDAPSGSDPVGLDMLHMGKGLAWLNGEEIGRYWPRKSSPHDNCVQQCNYKGKFMPDKCRTGCGGPTQRWYHVPRSWFKPSGNVLVIFEEKGGDPTKVVFSRRKISIVCALVAENYPLASHESSENIGHNNTSQKASVNLKCPTNSVISKVKFASYGTPSGTCGSYIQGDCHDPNTTSVVEKDGQDSWACEFCEIYGFMCQSRFHRCVTLGCFFCQACLNKNDCSLELGDGMFSKDLCTGMTMKLAIEAVCS